jgi:hypothetical protein
MRRTARTAIAVIATSVACAGHKTTTTEASERAPRDARGTQTMTTDACQTAAHAIQVRNFVGWRGFATGCTPHALVPGLPDPMPDLGEQPSRRLGADASSAAFVLLDLPGWYRPMASFRAGELVLVDGMNPELDGGAAPLLAELGAPATKLDWSYGTLPIAQAEWPYPDRGITVFLNTTSDKVLHLALYQPTTLDVYLRSLRPPLAKRPLPTP